MIEDSIQIRCTRCKSKFRDKARRVLNGYSRQCPACESIIFFDEGSANADVREAVRNAAAVRKALREEEAEQAARRAAAAIEQAGDEGAPVSSRRPVIRTVGRTRKS